MVTCTGLIGVLVSFFFVRLIDRRTVLLVGITACGICQLVPAIAWSRDPGSETTGKVVVAFISLFTFFYVAYGEDGLLRNTNELQLTVSQPHTHGFSAGSTLTTSCERSHSVSQPH